MASVQPQTIRLSLRATSWPGYSLKCAGAHRSNPLDLATAEQPEWPDHQNHDDHDEPGDVAHALADIALRQTLDHADDQAPESAPITESMPAEDHRRK